MSIPEKIFLASFILGIVVLGFSFQGWSYRNNENREPLSQQDKTSIAKLERQETTGRITSTQATMEKDSVVRDHILTF